MSFFLLSATIVIDLADGLFGPYIYIYIIIIYYVYNIYIYIIQTHLILYQIFSLPVVHYFWLTWSCCDPQGFDVVLQGFSLPVGQLRLSVVAFRLSGDQCRFQSLVALPDGCARRLCRTASISRQYCRTRAEWCILSFVGEISLPYVTG